MIELGGNITLVGFKDLGYAEFVVIKKLVGNHARKLADRQPFNNLTLTLKPIHRNVETNSSKYELRAKMDINGQMHHAETVEHNVFIGLDSILKKISSQI
jgi:ribosome-associated translation inhibitor RaiA